MHVHKKVGENGHQDWGRMTTLKLVYSTYSRLTECKLTCDYMKPSLCHGDMVFRWFGTHYILSTIPNGNPTPNSTPTATFTIHRGYKITVTPILVGAIFCASGSFIAATTMHRRQMNAKITFCTTKYCHYSYVYAVGLLISMIKEPSFRHLGAGNGTLPRDQCVGTRLGVVLVNRKGQQFLLSNLLALVTRWGMKGVAWGQHSWTIKYAHTSPTTREMGRVGR